MMLKKSKQQVIDEIRNAAYGAASQASNLNLTVDSYQAEQAARQLTQAIRLNGSHYMQQAIADAIAAGFQKLIENTYFEAEFEQDIGLR